VFGGTLRYFTGHPCAAHPGFDLMAIHTRNFWLIAYEFIYLFLI
jgi:hypothetical protein